MKHVLLDNVSHKDLRVNTVYLPGRGYDFNLARVFPSELADLQKEYPVFFFKNVETGHFEMTALLGFFEGENLYLSENGWDAKHIPITVQRQPFLIGFQERVVDGMPQQVPVTHIDLDHPNVSKTEGTPIFLPQGGESPYLEHVSAMLGAIYTGHDDSRKLSQALVGLELIESVAINVEFDNGMKHSLEGLYTLNHDRVRAMGAGALEALHRNGHLQHVFLILSSLGNFRHLVHRKNRSLARSRAEA